MKHHIWPVVIMERTKLSQLEYGLGIHVPPVGERFVNLTEMSESL